jgi:hypothetical protein
MATVMRLLHRESWETTPIPTFPLRGKEFSRCFLLPRERVRVGDKQRFVAFSGYSLPLRGREYY